LKADLRPARSDVRIGFSLSLGRIIVLHKQWICL